MKPQNGSEENLVKDIQRLFTTEPALRTIYGFAESEITTSAEVLAAVLAGLTQDKDARRTVRDLANEAFSEDPDVVALAVEDLMATAERDIDVGGIGNVLLFAPGLQGLLSQRVSRALLLQGRETASAAVKALLGRTLNIDLAPQAIIGRRVWIDHGLGVVVGRTAIIEDDVSLWHGVTLGSNLVDTGARRHPKIGKGAVLGAYATILGGIEIGAGAIVASGAIVTRDIPAGVTAYGAKATVRERGQNSFSGFNAAK
ncbi:MAG: serine acetyltransferase [Cognatishimia sp.]|uniref:serine O-acetyltransferase n=1 Tax=Cognatishimia sp. TaxID=2211648 RepID=UPI003B8E799E